MGFRYHFIGEETLGILVGRKIREAEGRRWRVGAKAIK